MSYFTIQRNMFIHSKLFVFSICVFVLSTDAGQMSYHVGRDLSQCRLGDQ